MTFASPALTHLALHVRDVEACIEFYRDYCGMQIIHERPDKSGRIVWLSEPGKEREFIFVILPGGPGRDQSERDFSHFGFALDSRDAVDALAARADAA
ncbi:MAG TPA: VOC family protein, partial [Rhodospirillaceae bacterium]|nr:VOC family protein [Rhodospirillaceae bacterium]